MDIIRSAVRPGVTFALVGAQIGLGFAWAFGVSHAEQAFAGLGTFTMLVVRDWFASREQESKDAGT